MSQSGLALERRPARRRALRSLGAVALLPGCTWTGTSPAPPEPGPIDQGLSGKARFFDARTGERLTARALVGRTLPAPILLLGEVHDNSDHHRLRGRLLLHWVRRSPARPSAIVFEHFDREHDEALRLAQRQSKAAPGSAARLQELLDAAGFDRQGWGWPAHQPLFEAAMESRANWVAANLSRASVRQSGATPGAAIDPALQAVVDSARWSAQAQQSLVQALTRGHCDSLSAAAVERFARVQRLRDAALALPLLDAGDRRTALLAGNGHVRRDHGVPRYLGAFEKEALVIGFEAMAPAGASGQSPAKADLPDLAELRGVVGEARAAELAAAYDLVCLTPAAGRDDPCGDFSPRSVNPAAPTQTPSR